MSDYLSIINLLVKYIEENLESDLTLDALSKEFNYSNYYIQRIFSSVTNISIHDYITKRRLIRAGEEILNGRGILETALKYGYSSHNGFTKAFEKKFGVPPSQAGEVINITADKPLRLLERDFYIKNGSICICHQVISLNNLLLGGDIYNVNLKDFWDDKRFQLNIEEKVISIIKSNDGSPIYCAAIPNDSAPQVKYFIGKVIEVKDADKYNKTLVLPGSAYVKFSYKGDIRVNPDLIIADSLKCFSACKIKPSQEKTDHIEIYTKDYLKTKFFNFLVPIKSEQDCLR